MLHTSHQALQERLASQYALSQATYFIGRHRFVFFSVASSYDLLDTLPEEYIAADIMPYWAEIWPASFVLAEYLLEDCQIQGKQCLELGAGVGVVSVVAAKAGAEVLATDYVVEALPFIELNAHANGVSLRTARLDWNDITLTEKFDVVLAADVLYERRNLIAVLAAIDKVLKPDGLALIATPRREMCSQFPALAIENGFAVSHIIKPLCLLGRMQPMDIYELTRKE
ncbi:MAG: methyltransferase domain-containing protein [Chloroherpetonaceae bacterium]|nr:methyltransferase domain-containing protein [Chloroherpetonaceae bacterium]MDW8018795.1 methyltransferase domain-containing protein [Chloroherpetonaceae bacterium]